MNSRDDVDYLLKLAEGFLREAEEDFQLKRWRACVGNAQLSVENSGKAILMLFGIPTKTHEPCKYLASILEDSTVPEEITIEFSKCIARFSYTWIRRTFYDGLRG